jgi:hypothetical protein
MDPKSESAPTPPVVPRPSSIVFRDWHTLLKFVGNARVAVAADESLLLCFAHAASSGAPPEICGRLWPSYHHAAMSLGDVILAAVEHAIDRMRLADMPRHGELPEDLRQKLRALVVVDLDPAKLQQLCAVEAVRAQIGCDTWRPPTRTYSGDYSAILTTEPIPGDAERPATTSTQLHIDCFYMMGALIGAHSPQ